MKVTIVRFGRTYNLGNYESVRVDLEAQLDENEPIELALDTLAIAARIYETRRFVQNDKSPLNLRAMTDVSVSYKHHGGTENLTGDPLEGVRTITGMRQLQETMGEEFVSEDFDPAALKK